VFSLFFSIIFPFPYSLFLFFFPFFSNLFKKSGAHLVGLQEVASKPIDDGSYHLREIQTKKLSECLGPEWNYFDQGILTPWLPLTRRHPQAILFRGKQISTSAFKWGIKIETSPNQFYFLFNCHFSYLPYQPYQLLKIEYEETPFYDTEKEAIQSALQSRQQQVEELLKDINDFTKNEDPKIPIFITGDFNEPSYLDWTERTAKIGRHPIKVSWPTTKILSEKGFFVDCFREKYPDEVLVSGNSWCTITSPDSPKDHHDRIDFLFVSQQHKNALRSVQLIGENEKNADIVITPYPSDHRAVLATFDF
jgi:exodeoxyribonuclease-3